MSLLIGGKGLEEMKDVELILAVARENLRKWGSLIPPREELYKLAKGECPHCQHVGPLESDFGFRTLESGDVRPQSWCRKCRANPRRGRRT